MDPLLLQSPSQLSLQLKSLRKARGLTQAEVARRLRIGQARYAQIELNPAAISTGRLLEIFAALGVDVLLRLRQESARTLKQGEDW